MSTRTISIVHKIDAVPTDFDSIPVLRDPALAYGVKAVVAGTVIVAANTPFVHDGTGLYSYEIDGLTAGLQYIAFIERVYLGETKRSSTTWTAGVSSAASRYAAQSDVENIFGPENVAVWSDMSNAGTVNTARVQLGLDNADAEIDGFFRDGPFAVPLSLASESVVMVRRWAAVFAGVWLYQNRGQWDEDKQGNNYSQMRTDVVAEMAAYKGGSLHLDAARRWPSPSAPVAV